MSKFFAVSALVLTFAVASQAQAQNYGGGFQGPTISSSTVAEALKLKDDTPVVLIGKIEKNLGNEKYQFSDGTGSIVVEIDDEDWRGLTVKPEDTVEISGEIDKEFMGTPKVDVDRIQLKK